jgi:hypothetical protein
MTMAADEVASQVPDQEATFDCPECALEGVAESRRSARELGIHRRYAHGVAGKSSSASSRQRRLDRATRSQAHRRVGGKTLAERILDYLVPRPGPHSAHEISIALGEGHDHERVGKNLSSMKSRGEYVDSDGRGHWWYTKGTSLPAKPVPTAVATVRDEQPKFNGAGKLGYFRQVEGFIILEDGDGSIWLAEKIR